MSYLGLRLSKTGGGVRPKIQVSGQKEGSDSEIRLPPGGVCYGNPVVRRKKEGEKGGGLSGVRSLVESVGEMSSQVLPWECRVGAGKELHRLCLGAELEAGNA